MNTKLPFALSAIGLLSLAIHQPAYAGLDVLPPKAPQAALTIEINQERGGIKAPAGAFVYDGVPFASADGETFLVIPEQGFSNVVQVPFALLNAAGQTVLGGLTLFVPGRDTNTPAAIATLFESQISQALASTAGAVSVALNPSVSPDLPFFASGTATPGTPAAFTATPGTAANLTLLNSFADPSAVSSTVTGVTAGTTVDSAANAALATTANAIGAAATVISQVNSQSIASGEDNIAVAVLATTVDNTTSTATVANTTVGVSLNNNATLSGSTSATVDANTLNATARANDSSGTLLATGANAGQLGNVASGPDNDNTYPAPGPLALTGDLLATGVQQLDQASNVTASLTASVGVHDGANTASINAITGGVSVNGNTAAAAADGNRLALSFSDQLSGGDVDSTVYGLQTAGDSNISATANVLAGVDVTTLTGNSLTVQGNSTQATAAANRATATVDARPDQASDSLNVDVEQFLRAQGAAVALSASSSGSSGITGTTLGNSRNSITGNRATALVLGNEQATTADLGQGVQAGPATVEGNQTLLADGQALALSATTSGGFATAVTGDTASTTTVSGNTGIAQALGNNAAQAVGGLAGVRSGALAVSQTQNAVSDAVNAITLDADLTGFGIGASATTLSQPQLAVTGNQAASLLTVNRNSQSLGANSGSSTAAGTVAASATQLANSLIAGAEVNGLRLGVINPTANIIGTNAGDANLTVSNNQVDAQAELNRSTQSLDGLSGATAGAVSLTTTQTANSAAAPNVGGVDAALVGTGVGLYGPTAEITLQDDSAFNLVTNGNQLASTAQANLASVAVGPISGTVSANVTAGITQAADGLVVGATNLDTGFGIAEAAPATTLFNAADNTSVSVTVADNSLQAVSRQNSGSIAQGSVSGAVQLGNLSSQITQTSTTGGTNASNSGVFAGVNAAVGANALGLGNASVATNLAVNGNSVRADAADNLATVVAAGVNGSVGATASVGGVISQSSTGGQINATNSLIGLGAVEQNNTNLNEGAGTLAITVADNSTVAVASGNNSSASLGGVNGGIAASGSAGITTTQTLDSQVTASSGQISAGISNAALGNNAGAGAASLTVSGNGVVTAASGNDSRVVDLGDSAASIAGTLGSTTTQTVSTNASLAASASAINLGATGLTAFGTASAAAVTVDGNAITTTATANNSSVAGSVAGTLTGAVNLATTQTLNGSAAGISASTGTALSPNLIGVSAADVGANAAVSVANNTVTSAVNGNRVLNNLDGLAFSSATGTVSFTATQNILGNAGAAVTGDLNAEVRNTTVGLVATTGATLPAVAVSGNRLVASTLGNESNRVLNNLSGNFDAATQSVLVNDNQTTNGAVLLATVADSRIGSQLFSDLGIPTSVTVNGNSVVAQAIANSSNQRVALNGVSTVGGPLTSLNAGQNLINTTVNATISNVSLGLTTNGVALGAGNFTGAAVTAGNSLNANAIGNQASLVRVGR